MVVAMLIAPSSLTSADDRWWVMRTLQGTYPGWMMDSHGIQILGWTELALTGSSTNASSLPQGMNYLPHDLTVPQNWLRIERAVDEDSTCVDWGFRSDWIVPGTDYRFTLPRGLWNGQQTADNGEPAKYGIDAVQGYVVGHIPQVASGMNVKLGRFFLPYGVESTEAVSTPYVSRAYTFLYNPFTQVGVMTTAKINTTWSVYFGVTAGNDCVIDPVNEPTVDVGFRWDAPDERQSINVFAIIGEARFNEAEDFNNVNIFDIVYTRKWTTRFNTATNVLWGYERDVPDVGNVHWLGLVEYLSYDLLPSVTAVARGECFWDPQGNRTGFEGTYTSLTTGLIVRPRPHLIVRPEVRWDYNAESRPFEGNHGLLATAVGLIIRW